MGAIYAGSMTFRHGRRGSRAGEQKAGRSITRWAKPA